MRFSIPAFFLMLTFTLFSVHATGRRQAAASVVSKLRNGDIVFQYIPCGDLCIAIAETTPCARERPFNHCGIIIKAGDSVSVIEAIGKTVKRTPLEAFLKRDSSAWLFVGRPLKASGIDTRAALRLAKGMTGRPYDDAFLPGDSALYCSELVYESYRVNGSPAFALTPMTFKSPRTGHTFPAWTNYYNDLGLPIPEGKPGINPCAIANAPFIRLMAFRQEGR